ncbi:MAG: recombination regulator RecX [gamma proteobacterium symbiont of Taylorina sp.]|nr:recombination regulator RecX [gamma proteobacterium symbiont of Taylorina sp.]
MSNNSLNCEQDSGERKQTLASIRTSAMNILAVREHSTLELRKKLSNKLRTLLSRKEKSLPDSEQFDELIEIVLQKLIIDNLLNEARFTESFIRSRLNKGFGPVKITHELNERGIPNDLINDYLESSYDFWQQRIETVHHKRFGNMPPKDYQEQTKQSRFLYQRGFSGELIRYFFNQTRNLF